MSLALSNPTTIARPVRRRGRPRVDQDLRQRDLHYKAAYWYFLAGMLPKQVAGALEITKPTVFRWIRLALSYDDDRTLILRRSIARTALGQKWLKRVRVNSAA